MLIFLFPVYDLQKDEKIVKGFHEIRRDSFHRLCWLYFERENQLWVKFLAEYFRHKPSHLNIKKRQSGGGNILTRWLRVSSTLTWSWTRTLKLDTRPHLLGWIQEWKEMSPHLGVDQELGMLEIGKPKKEDALPVVSPDLELRRKTVKVSFFCLWFFTSDTELNPTRAIVGDWIPSKKICSSILIERHPKWCNLVIVFAN